MSLPGAVIRRKDYVRLLSYFHYIFNLSFIKLFDLFFFGHFSPFGFQDITKIFSIASFRNHVDSAPDFSTDFFKFFQVWNL